MADFSQTQQETEDLVNDIFGSDDDADTLPSQSVAKKINDIFGDDDDDDDLNDSDDDNRGGSLNRLQKSSKSSTKKPLNTTVADIFGSDDDEDDNEILKPKKITKRKRSREENTHKKSKHSIDATGRQNEHNSGDEYDSGDELAATKDDDAFIDEDEDDMQKDIMKEYDQDNQDFNDDRPNPSINKKKTSKKSSSNSVSQAKGSGPLDPIQETMLALKKPKEIELAEVDKEKFVKILQNKMSMAYRKDELAISQAQPAVNKLLLLPSIKKTFSIISMHEKLVECDILTSLKQWIDIKDLKSSLPSLEMRSTIYDLLMMLPCESDHLKRSGIGMTIMLLKKHSQETISNKNKLKLLIEKWCRPLFGKTTAPQRFNDIDISNELKVAASYQKFTKVNANTQNNNANNQSDKSNIDNILSNDNNNSSNDAKIRVKTPYR